MNNRYKNIIRNFFSDYVAWLLVVSFLFIVTLVAIIAFGNANGFIWVVPILFLVIYCFSFPLLILYLKARKDLKESNIDVLTIKTFTIEQDGTFGFKNRGGATVGKRKYRIIDENRNYFLLSTANEKDMILMFYPNPTFSLEVEALGKSRIILRMKIVEDPVTSKKIRKQRHIKHNISHFRKTFSHYL